jgi:hypothetical protein
MKYKKGDILICSKKQVYGQQLFVGDKYKINGFIEEIDSEVVLHVTHDKTNNRITFVSDKHFITLQAYRSWKLKNILK